MSRYRRTASEFVGTALLLVAVVGSGIMGARLSNGNDAIALIANSLATGAALFALISSFGPISGAHFNPAVTLVAAAQGRLASRDVFSYVPAQVAGALAGVAWAHVMFGLPLYSASAHVREGWAQLMGEFLATFGLITVILVCSRDQTTSVASVVAAYITGAYWFTSSTSFANPAVTIARTATDTFSGIRPGDAPAFIAAQALGTAAAAVFCRWVRVPIDPSTGQLQSEKVITQLKKRILFLCTGNSARSQMAEGLMRSLAGDKYEVFSAGTYPKGVHPRSLEVMQELGIDLSRHTSKDVKDFLGQSFDYVITVCDRARQLCPVFPGSVPIHWGFDDPAEAEHERELLVFRRVRDEIQQRIHLFLMSNRD